MQVLERDLERRFLARLKRIGVRTLKLNVMGQRGWPDRMVLIPGGRPLLIELKQPGGKTTPLQDQIHAMLRELEYDVLVCDDVDKAVAAVIQAGHHATGCDQCNQTCEGET